MAGSPATRRFACVAAWAALLLFPFIFWGDFGERDTYRMFAALAGKHGLGALANPDSYNRGTSFAYYEYVGALMVLLGSGAGAIAAIMNVSNAIFGVLTSVMLYDFARRHFGERAGMAAAILLLAMPAVWYTGLYGHPMMPALLFLLAAFSTVETTAGGWIATIALLSVGLSFRLDLALVVPAFVPLLRMKGVSWRLSLVTTAGIAIVSLALTLGVRHTLLGSQPANPDDSTVALLARHHDPRLLLVSDNLYLAIERCGECFNPLWLGVMVFGLPVLRHRLDTNQWLFLAYGFGVNVLFFLPNPHPSRHFMFAAPFACIALGVVLEEWLLGREWFGASWLREAAATGAIAIVSIGASILLSHVNFRVLTFESLYAQRWIVPERHRAAQRLALVLATQSNVGTPALVFTDARLVIGKLFLDGATPRVGPQRVLLEQGVRMTIIPMVLNGSSFFLLEQSWEPRQRELVRSLEPYRDYAVIADPGFGN